MAKQQTHIFRRERQTSTVDAGSVDIVAHAASIGVEEEPNQDELLNRECTRMNANQISHIV
ncbi:MAG: hypothetical protein ABGZ17_25300 [Planctomycetaceae bacterium]